LKRDGLVDHPIFDFFELCVADNPSGELLLRLKQLRRPKQAADNVGVDSGHKALSPAPYDRLSSAVPDIGDFNQFVGSNPINDAVGISGSQERAVALKGIEHGWSHFGKVAQEFKFSNDLVLNCKGQTFQISLGPWKEFNLSWHALPFWP
jgi:hypothetical protein